MFSSDRIPFRGSVLHGAPPPPPSRVVRPDEPSAAWLLDDLGDGTCAELPPFGGTAADAARAGLTVEQLAAQRAADEAACHAAEERRLAAEAEEEALRREAEINAAYEAGLEAGRAEGEAAAREELDAVVAALMQALADVRGGEQRWLAALEENVAALATAVARHVLGRDAAMDPSAVVSLARQAVAEFPVDEPLTIRLAPEDLPAVKAALAAGAAAAPTAPVRETRWVADPHLARGGALVEGRERIVDGRVDTALERVYRRLSNHNV